MKKQTPSLRNVKPPETTAPPSTDAPNEEQKAVALNFGLKWKAKATQKKQEEEESPLLKPASTSVNEEQQEKSEDAEAEEPFYKTLTKSIFYMLFGTFLVAFFSDPMVD